VRVPTLKEVVVYTATPLVTGAVASSEFPLVKRTFPLGTAYAPLTVAVNVTACPEGTEIVARDIVLL
jgi:hypothetical protein